jgi:Rps23 Pro-64 3,4-dihydroxylase Tpa1-like proline 4-hydroxylase
MVYRPMEAVSGTNPSLREECLVPPTDRWEAALSAVDRVAYESAPPWPHLVIDGVFDPMLISAAEVEQTSVAGELRALVTRRLVKAERSLVVGAASEALMAHLDSVEFVAFLVGLTGIEGLQPDPSRSWAGLHVGRTGAFQSVHRDFQKHPATGLYHRVNVLLYLSSGWSPDEGGALELWSPDARRAVRSILPAAGRLVIFESHARTPHAVARQTSPDPDRLRLSFAAYYYSPHPPAVGLRRMGTLIQPRIPGEPWFAQVIDAVSGVGARLAALPAHMVRHVRRPRPQRPPQR